MTARLLAISLLTTLALPGCSLWDEGEFGKNGTIGGGGGSSGGTDDTGPSNDDTGDTDSDDTGPSTDDTSTSSDDTSGGDTSTEYMDDPGDVLDYEDESGLAEVDLSDESGETNKDQEFYLIVVNTGSSSISYDLRYSESAGASAAMPHAPHARPTPSVSPFRTKLREARETGALGTAHPLAAPPSLDLSDVGVTVREFRARNDYEDEDSYELIDATLWAVGDTVAIWVDSDVAIDWDYECDGSIDVKHRYDSYGFDNCDLQTIADIVDSNIFPNLNTLFGDESDVNGDGLVSVVITPLLNALPLTSDDEDDWTGVVESYADPEVDLTEWDADTNPASDEQEVIYVFAPDPYGLYNPLATATIEEYTSVALTAQIARAFEGLISYNQHVLENEGEVEESWMNDALGSVAADITGFGAVFYDDAWNYLDASHNYPLVESDEEGSISSANIGAQYLFARWLVDTYGTELLASLVQSSSVGVDVVEEATGEDFADLVVRWQVAMLTTGVTTSDGDQLVSSDTYTPYQDASIISAPITAPMPGDYYGANGYQTGINLRDSNLYMEGGTTAAPEENTANRVLLGGTDHYTHVTGLEFTGYVEADYAAQVVRLVGVPYANTNLEIQGSDEGMVGAVVRWNNPSTQDYAVEDVFSPTDSNNMQLPDLLNDGTPVYAVGRVSSPGLTVVVDADGTETDTDVYDTDRWLLDLSDAPPTRTFDVAIWLDRRFDETGEVSLEDPWFAVVPIAYVPSPTVDGTARGVCSDGAEFAYPASVLDYLYYQVFLSPEAFSEDSDDEFDACGTASDDPTTCGDDWDLDGVADEDEPQPATFLEQLQVMQCTLAGGDSTAYTALTTAVFDDDSTDDDDVFSFDRALNLGGLSGADGEEAFMVTSLKGGSQYLIIVGGGEDTGAYELTIQPLE